MSESSDNLNSSEKENREQEIENYFLRQKARTEAWIEGCREIFLKSCPERIKASFENSEMINWFQILKDIDETGPVADVCSMTRSTTLDYPPEGIDPMNDDDWDVGDETKVIISKWFDDKAKVVGNEIEIEFKDGDRYSKSSEDDWDGYAKDGSELDLEKNE